MKEFVIKENLFKTSTIFILNCSGKEFAKRIKKMGVKTDIAESYVCGTVIPCGDRFFRGVWVESAKDLGGIMHEISHLVVRVCTDKGVPIKANIETGEVGDETFAYLIEFYTNEIFKKLKIKIK